MKLKPIEPQKPWEPIKPVAPSLYIDVQRYINFDLDNNYTAYWLPLQQVLDKVKEANIDISEAKLYLSIDECGDQGGAISAISINYIEKNAINPNYKTEMAAFKLSLKQYEKKLDKYNKDLIKYQNDIEKYNKSMDEWNKLEATRIKKTIKELEQKLAELKK
jgi:hypothetical protein